MSIFCQYGISPVDSCLKFIISIVAVFETFPTKSIITAVTKYREISSVFLCSVWYRRVNSLIWF